MARIEARRRGAAIVAESPEELALLSDALARGAELPLREGLYPISRRSLAVPAGFGRDALEALRRDFEAAARSHERALRRRRSFRAV